jgi:hypothetical protein
MCTILLSHLFVCVDVIPCRLRLDIAGMRSPGKHIDPAKHILIITKVTTLRFGVTLFRTTRYITFDGMFTLVSFIGSAFLFLLGLAHVSKV